MTDGKITALAKAVMARVTPLYPLAPLAGGLTWGIGKKVAKGHVSPPRVVWVPTTETFDGPTKTKYGSMIQRALRTRISSLEARCWAADDGAVELLFSQVVNAMHAEAVGSYETVSGEWVTQETNEYETLGELYVLTFALRIPLVEIPALTTVTVSAVAINPTGAVTGDNTLQAGETP